MGCYGPALMDLRHIAGVNIGDIVLMLTSKRAGALLGSLLGGAIYDKWNRHIPIILAVSVIGLTSIGIPWCSMIILMIVLATLQGIANGMLETCKYTFHVFIWGIDVLILPMLRLIQSKQQRRKDIWKLSKPCHVGIHGKALAEYSQMSTHTPGFWHHYLLSSITRTIRANQSSKIHPWIGIISAVIWRSAVEALTFLPHISLERSQ